MAVPGFTFGQNNNNNSFQFSAPSTSASFTFGGLGGGLPAAPTPATNQTQAPQAQTSSTTTGFGIQQTPTPAPTCMLPPTSAPAPAPAPVNIPVLNNLTLPTAPADESKAVEKPALSLAIPTTNTAIASTRPDRSLPFALETVDTIIKTWKQDLSQDIKDFKSQARRVSDWESQLHENTKNAQQLSRNIGKVELYYDEIQNGCSEIELWQKELESELEDIENSLQKYVDEVDANDEEIGENDVEREDIFHEGENLNKYLQDMESKLEKIMKDFALARGEGGKEDSNNPIVGIMQILNSHHNNLAYLDKQTRLLYDEITALKETNN